MAQRKSFIKPTLVFMALIVVIAFMRTLELEAMLPQARQWVTSLGWLAPVVFILLYAMGVILALPGVLLTITAATLFGVVGGIIVSSLGSTLGASLAFLIARYAARSTVAGWVHANERFQKIDRASEHHGAMMVFLVRFVPVIPFNIVNYAFGLTRVRFWTYVFWSWLSMLPWTIIYVVGADAGVNAASGQPIPWLWIALSGVLILLVFIIGRWAKSRLQHLESKS